MTTVLVATAPAAASRRAALWNRVSAGAHRRAGRVEWIVLVLVMLVPQLVVVPLVTG